MCGLSEPHDIACGLHSGLSSPHYIWGIRETCERSHSLWPLPLSPPKCPRKSDVAQLGGVVALVRAARASGNHVPCESSHSPRCHLRDRDLLVRAAAIFVPIGPGISRSQTLGPGSTGTNFTATLHRAPTGSDWPGYGFRSVGLAKFECQSAGCGLNPVESAGCR